ncbi:MAG: hypothetical protein KF825_04085 [Ferruginibacter sp.]|nr:hypothetical protein [Ferruginibacter sp.]
MKKIALSAICFLVTLVTIKANNVVVSTVSLGPKITAGPLSTHYTQVNYDIAWQNSWRTSTNESNYDGCWIFVKYRKQSTSVWQHATLNTTGQVIPTGSVIKISADGKGAWMYRNADGIGNVNWTAAGLRWNYGTDGVLDNENVEVRVYAVEMVYVPQSPFNLGNSSNETYKFRDGLVDTWFPVTSENAINCGTNAGELYADTYFDNTGTIPAAFPKGYNAFWSMKYEFSRQQVVDFLNTLDQTNANARNSVGATGLVPNMVVTEPERAADLFSIQNFLAWLDWAAMRPMTELEYEKACRGGNNLPSPLEYAWGNTTISAITTASNQGAANETWATGNANYAGGPGVPMRCGALATATSNRTSSGATFYGIMEMSGNYGELVVHAGNTTGRSFNGIHGDGVLSATAEANTLNWQSPSNNYAMATRGGAYISGPTSLRICDRSSGTLDYASLYGLFNGRAVRTGE